MPLTSEVQPWRVKTIPGMNTKMENFELQSNWVELAQNCRFEEELGTVKKREPISYFNPGAAKIGTDPIVSLIRYYKSDGTAKFIAIAGTGVYVGNDSTGAFTSIRTLANTGKRCAWVVYDDLLIGYNGYDNNFVYDGTTDNLTWELGACKALLTADGSNLDSGATYKYKITFDTDAIVNGAVSNTVTTNAGNRKVTLSNIPLGPVGCANRKIYRTEGGGAAFKLLATLSDNTTTTYVDDIADGSLTDAYPSVTDAMPKGNIPILFRERVFLAGDPSNPNTIAYSYPYLPHIMLQTSGPDTLLVSPDDGDEITGLGVHLGIFVCIKKNNLRKMYVAGPDSTWYAEDPQVHIGSPAQWSVTNTLAGIAFLGWNHWYLWNGSTVDPIADEFDTADILKARYSETVGYYHEDHLLAAYTDTALATQYHNRVMRWNMKRGKLSVDTINANCFAAKRGDDETGELYYGSSYDGFVYKGSNEEIIYRLNTKTDINLGTNSGVFVGGLEAAPYIEIGSTTAASAIPDNICILWDNETESPGTGWTEITSTYDGKFIKLNQTAADTGGDPSHTHSISGTLLTSSGSKYDAGDGGQDITYDNHTHTVAAAASGAADLLPKYVQFRVFKSASNTATEFPVGAIVMYDDPTPPDGWVAYDLGIGYYVRIGSTGLGVATDTSHSHTFSLTSAACTSAASDSNGLPDPGTHPRDGHTHTMSGTTAEALPDWELAHIKVRFIQRIGETSTWDGVAHYVYALGIAAGSPTGWTEITTYDDKYLKIGDGDIATGDAVSSAHTHTITNGTSAENGQSNSSNGGYNSTGILNHTHTYSLTTADGSITEPAYVTFRLFKMVLGKMKDYNAAIEANDTAGDWTSPSMQINASSLGKLYWNQTVLTGDAVSFKFRTGATQVACEAASWSSAITDPNGLELSSYVNTNLWIQYIIYLTATDSTVSNPRVYFADGFVVKFLYSQAATYAEAAVEFRYKLGYRNFDMPMMDKIHKKIGTVHDGSQGSVIVKWSTENANDSMVISLLTNPEKWASFFQDTAMGEKLDIEIYKNDLYDFVLKEVNGVFSPEPLIL